MDIKKYVTDLATEAKAGARSLGKASSGQKNSALVKMAEAFFEEARALIV